MLDRLEWWQVLAMLAPVYAILYWIRWRETRAASTQYAEMTSAQRAWILLTLLPPGAAARLQERMSENELRGYVTAGSSIRGNGRNLAKPVLKAFLKSLKPDRRKQLGANLDEQLVGLGRWAELEPDHVLERVVALWPSGAPVSKPAAAPPAAAEIAPS